MYVALFVAMLATGEIQAVVYPTPLTKAECEAKNAGVDKMVRDGMVEGVRKHALYCIKVDPK